MSGSVMLVIAEKPSAAADIAKALTPSEGPFSREDWGYRSAGVWVTAASGHLMEICPPGEQDPAWKAWLMETLPMLPDDVKYRPRPGKAASALSRMARLLASSQVGTVVNACDAGREGELIFQTIMAQLQSMSPRPGIPIRRLWLSSLTEASVAAAMGSLLTDQQMRPLHAAARCRDEADWVIGMNCTRAASCTLGGGRKAVHLGRVQTPTMALVARRDDAIEGFEPVPYWKVEAVFSDPESGREYSGTWLPSDRGAVPAGISPSSRPHAVYCESVADAALASLREETSAAVTSHETEETAVHPPLLHSLTSLQKEANRRLSMTAGRTLEVAQSLYETHKMLSYPRTDSRHLTADVVPGLMGTMRHVRAMEAYRPLPEWESPAWDSLVSESKVADHYALVPVGDDFGPGRTAALSSEEAAVLDLVVRRVMEATGPAGRRSSVRCETITERHSMKFVSTSSEMTDPGWTAWSPSSRDDGSGPDEDAEDAGESQGQSLSWLSEGDRPNVSSASKKQLSTRPPKAYTDATLLADMEKAGGVGIGTPATRAGCIETLVRREYLTRSGRRLSAAYKARRLTGLLDGMSHPLASAALTAELEEALAAVEASSPADCDSHARKFRARVRAEATAMVSSFEGADDDLVCLGPCPSEGCGGRVMERKKSWGCDSYKGKDDPGCGYVIWKSAVVGSKQVTVDEGRARQAVADGERLDPGPRRKALGPCPSEGCGGTVLTYDRHFGCDSYKGKDDPGCGTFAWRKTKGGKRIPVSQVREKLGMQP